MESVGRLNTTAQLRRAFGTKADGFQWNQTVQEVDVQVPIDEGVRGRECDVVIKAGSIKVAVRGNVVLDGECVACFRRSRAGADGSGRCLRCVACCRVRIRARIPPPHRGPDFKTHRAPQFPLKVAPDDSHWQIEPSVPTRRDIEGTPRHISILLVKCVSERAARVSGCDADAFLRRAGCVF